LHVDREILSSILGSEAEILDLEDVRKVAPFFRKNIHRYFLDQCDISIIFQYRK